MSRVIRPTEWPPRTGTLKFDGSSAVTEGVGIARFTADRERQFLGCTSGANAAAAVRVAREPGSGNTAVTMLCDVGHKYVLRFCNL